LTEEKRLAFGENLKIMRIENDLTQKDCSKMIGCTERALYRWEQGLTYPLPVYRTKIGSMFPELGEI
jgi:transcriptional regulator with XRE-family HTH domain